MEWKNIWWVCDISYLSRLFFHSYINTEVDFAKKTVDSVMSEITWCLEKEPAMAFLALDSGESVRKNLFPGYKIGRQPPPDGFFACYDAIIRDCVNLGLNVVAADGWEADDVMATVAQLALKDNKKCVLMTNDKDVRQCLKHGLVTSQRRLRDSLGRPCWGWMTAADAEKDWGLSVNQFIDYQILWGDSTDKIPGVEGVGEVKARGLLKQYGTIEEMKKHLIPGKVGENLKAFWSKEPVVRQLVTLNENVDFKNVF